MKDFVQLIYSEGSCVWSTGSSLLLFQTEIKKLSSGISAKEISMGKYYFLVLHDWADSLIAVSLSYVCSS